MKKSVLLILGVLLHASTIFAQHELAFNIGQSVWFREVQPTNNIDMSLIERENPIVPIFEFQYKYRISDQFVVGTTIPYIFFDNNYLFYTNKISENPRVRQSISGHYEKQSTGLIIQAEVRPNFTKNLLCLYAGFGFLYHTIHRINAELVSTSVDFTTTSSEKDVILPLSNRSELVANVGAAFQAKINSRIGLKLGMTYFFAPGVESQSPYQISAITQHCVNFSGGIVYYWGI